MASLSFPKTMPFNLTFCETERKEGIQRQVALEFETFPYMHDIGYKTSYVVLKSESYAGRQILRVGCPISPDGPTKKISEKIYVVFKPNGLDFPRPGQNEASFLKLFPVPWMAPGH